MELGGLIRAARKTAGLTQEKASENLNVSRQTLSNWENGKTYPDIVSVIKMSDLYSVSLDCLLKGDVSVEQPYQKFLEESTNIVKSREKQTKTSLVLVTLGIWVIAMTAIGLVRFKVDTVGMGLIVVWIVLPVTFFVIAMLIGRYNYFGRYNWLVGLGMNLMYTLSSYATSIASSALPDGRVYWPVFTKLPIGLVIACAGLGIGILIRKRKNHKIKQKM